MLSKEYKSTRELLEALMEGGEAVKRDNPRGNETSYFFMVPKAQSPTGEEVINVPDDVDPQVFKAAGYKVPETASASTSMGNNSWNSTNSMAASSGGNTNPSSSSWGSSTSEFGSTGNSSTSNWGSLSSPTSSWGNSTTGLGTTNPWGNNTGLGSSFNPTNQRLNDSTSSSSSLGVNGQSNSSSPLTPSSSSTTPRQGGYGLLSAMMFDKDAHIAEETEAELKALQNAKKNANTFNFGVNASLNRSYPQTNLSSMSGTTLSNSNPGAGLTTLTTPAGLGSMGSTTMGLDAGFSNTGLNDSYNNGLNFTSTAGLSDSMGLNGLDTPYNTQNVLNGGASSLMGTTPGLSNPGTEPSTADWVNQVKLATEQKLDQDALTQNALTQNALTQNALSQNMGVDSLTQNTAVDSLIPNTAANSLTQNPAYPTTNLPYQMSMKEEFFPQQPEDLPAMSSPNGYTVLGTHASNPFPYAAAQNGSTEENLKNMISYAPPRTCVPLPPEFEPVPSSQLFAKQMQQLQEQNQSMEPYTMGKLFSDLDISNKDKFDLKPQYRSDVENYVPLWCPSSPYEQQKYDDWVIQNAKIVNTKHEEEKDYPYLDYYGYITSGRGHLMDSEKEFIRHPWRHRDTKELMTIAEKKALYQRIEAERARTEKVLSPDGKKEINPYCKIVPKDQSKTGRICNTMVERQERLKNIGYLDEEYIDALQTEDLRNSMAAVKDKLIHLYNLTKTQLKDDPKDTPAQKESKKRLRALYKKFEGKTIDPYQLSPYEIKELLDFHFNTGQNLSNTPNKIWNILNQNFKGAAVESHRAPPISKDRNQWAADMYHRANDFWNKF